MNKQTEHTRKVYNRRAASIARGEKVDLMLTKKLRRRQWEMAPPAGRILEIGVGTGVNFGFYPPEASVTAIDLGEQMVALAKDKAARLAREVDLRVMDVQKLDFPDNSFDAAIASFVFCSVPDPAMGLSEINRVLKPGGTAVFLEHVRSANRLIGWLMDRMSPLLHRREGMHINRRTVEIVESSELGLVSVEDVALGGIVKLINAKKTPSTS
jgi:phosphatidylethanolamine/phosphatidyl-N-methylethanolamine N-methyltransferase